MEDNDYYDCYGCKEGLENQLSHIGYGGCLYEYESNMVTDVKSLNNFMEDILKNNHFIATQIPIYFSDTNYPTSFIDYLISTAKEYDLNINCGDWVFTPYHVPHDIAREGAEYFSWDHIYKVPDKYVKKLNQLKGTSIRYGLPVGEEFVQPIRKQYYGHPALFDLKSNKPFQWSQSKKRGMKKLYEYNQLRILNIEKSGLNFKSYKL